MKNLFLIILIFLGMISLSHAECQGNFQSRTFTFMYFTLDENGANISCPITVTYCYKCNPTAFGLQVENIEYYNPCNIKFNDDFVIQRDNGLFNDLLLTGCIAPCNANQTNMYELDIQELQCYKVVHPQGCDQAMSYYKLCPTSAQCIVKYQVCVAYGPNGAYLQRTLVRKIQIPGDNCPYPQILVLPPPNISDPCAAWETYCFQLPSNCQ